jgi:hypothetical protein
MNRPFHVPVPYSELALEIEEKFKALHIYTDYIMFTQSSIAELKCVDEESFRTALAHFKLLVKKHTHLDSVVGVEEDWVIFIHFQK